MPLRVWNELEDQWLNVPVGHWIIKGMKGEFYPCDPEVFAEKYEKWTPNEEPYPLRTSQIKKLVIEDWAEEVIVNDNPVTILYTDNLDAIISNIKQFITGKGDLIHK